MTIALGIVASDGIVLAADTLETSQGYWKGELGKVRWLDHLTVAAEGRSIGACIVSGAGRTSLMVSLSQRLLGAFSEDKQIEEPEHLRLKFEGVLQEFFASNVIPFAPFGDPHDQGLQMVLGYQRNSRYGLWSSDRASLTDQAYAAVGVGHRHAKTLLQQMAQMYELGVHTVAAIAAYVIFDVKENVDGCGRYTDIAFIQDHRVRIVARPVVEALEDTFREFSSRCQRSLLRCLFEETGTEFKADTLDSVRRQVAHLIAKMPQTS